LLSGENNCSIAHNSEIITGDKLTESLNGWPEPTRVPSTFDSREKRTHRHGEMNHEYTTAEDSLANRDMAHERRSVFLLSGNDYIS
jgi:hypothetical protein